MAANVDQVLIVASLAPPFTPTGLIDRYLLAAYIGGLKVVLALNKFDLAPRGSRFSMPIGIL